ncbi:MAG: type II toxin-antitoxin system VapC family toxin [Candidatus Limnocylindrales bacterium]
MNHVFADACYWIALINRDDELHHDALAAQSLKKDSTVYTTDEVLGEVLNFFSNRGAQWRGLAVSLVEGIRNDSRVVVNEQSRVTFDRGLGLYKGRSDKGYSLVDCVSFLAMQHDGITEALTNDRHFEQEQFIAILRPPTR